MRCTFRSGSPTATRRCGMGPRRATRWGSSTRPRREGGLAYDDPRLGLDWPLPVTAISDKDRGGNLSRGRAGGATPDDDRPKRQGKYMIILDTALRAREEQGTPIRVGMVGAGSWRRASRTRSSTACPACSSWPCPTGTPNGRRGAPLCRCRADPDRRPSGARRRDPRRPSGVTDDPLLLCRSEQIDVVCEVTGDVEYAAHVVLEAFNHGKDVVLMNAEIDATIGPILQVYAERHGVIMSACDGDEPGVQMNLYRWVKGLGLEPRVLGNVKGLQDPYRNPTTQQGFAEQWGQNPRW